MDRSVMPLRRSRLLLWAALVMFGWALNLPWETIPLSRNRYGDGGGYSRYLQVPRRYLIERKIIWNLRQRDPWMSRGGIVSYEPVDETRSLADEMPVFMAREFWRHGVAWSRTPNFQAASWWMLMTFAAWLAAALGMAAMPWAAGWLSRAGPILWMARFFAVSMLAWLLRHLILAQWQKEPPGLGHVGAGYWWMLVALVVEIAGLFMIPKAGPLSGVNSTELQGWKNPAG